MRKIAKLQLINIVRTSGGADNDKKINNLAKREKKMLEITKRDYDTLKYYGSYTKKQIGYFEHLKTDKISEEDKDRLVKLEWIDFDHNSQKLHNLNFFVTEKGYAEIRKLEAERHEDWKLWAAIATLIVSVIIFTKAQGWW